MDDSHHTGEPHTCQPGTAYLVCATPRSGSSLLCEALWNTGLAGQPDEYFRPANLQEFAAREGTLADWARWIWSQGRSENGVVGAKLMWGDLQAFADRFPGTNPNGKASPRDVIASFPVDHFIWIRRKDKVRQAVSLSKALQSGVFRVEKTQLKGLERTPEFRLGEIHSLACRLRREDACWEDLLSELPANSLVVTYEELQEDYEGTVRRVLRHLNLWNAGLVVPPARLSRQADAESEDWVNAYHNCGTAARLWLWWRSPREWR